MKARVMIFLHPGNLIAEADDVDIITILGSCVSVCLGDPEKRIGGMNHFQMPGGADDSREPLRYGPTATRALYERVLYLGASRQRLEAMVFGGASMLHGGVGLAGGLGSENAAVALRTLESLGVRIVASDLEGRRARKLVYRVADGSVTMRPI